MIGVLSEADAEYFFANRQAAGFNAQWINLLCNTYTGCRADGSTNDGVPPFTTQGDLSTPNEAYFSKVDHIVQLAAKHGQVVLLDPIETGGWTNVAVANGPTRAFNYGKYLGQRYKSFPNIIWMSGNDYQNWGDATVDASVRAVATGIKETDPNHLQTVELNYQRSGSLDAGSWAPLVNLDARRTRISRRMTRCSRNTTAAACPCSWSRRTTRVSTTPRIRAHPRSCAVRSTGPC